MIRGLEVQKKSYSLKWDIEDRCNLKCKHCMLSEVTYKPECTPNENKLFLKRLIDLGINQVLFMSKEPLLYNSIEKLVKYAHNRGVGTGIITNGTLLTYSKVEKLLKAGLDTLIISLEGVDSVTNDYIRGAGTYKKVIDALKIVERVFRENNKGFRLVLEYTISKNNLHEPLKLIEFLNNNLFEIVNVGTINLIGEAKRYKEIIPDETEVMTYIKNMMLEYKRFDVKRYTIFSKSLYPYQIIKLNTCFGIDLNFSTFGCSVLQDEIVLGADGTLKLCSLLEENNKWGDIRIGDISNLNDRDLNKKIKEAQRRCGNKLADNSSICMGCEFINSCFTCPAVENEQQLETYRKCNLERENFLAFIVASINNNCYCRFSAGVSIRQIDENTWLIAKHYYNNMVNEVFVHAGKWIEFFFSKFILNIANFEKYGLVRDDYIKLAMNDMLIIYDKKESMDNEVKF